MWCVFYPNGEPDQESLSECERESRIRAGAIYGYGEYNDSEWELMKGRGFTCQGVAVTIKPIK